MYTVAKSKELLSSLDTAQIIIATSYFQTPRIDAIGLIIVQSAGNPRSPDYNANKEEFMFLSQCLSYRSEHIIFQTRDSNGPIIRSLME